MQRKCYTYALHIACACMMIPFWGHGMYVHLCVHAYAYTCTHTRLFSRCQSADHGANRLHIQHKESSNHWNINWKRSKVRRRRRSCTQDILMLLENVLTLINLSFYKPNTTFKCLNETCYLLTLTELNVEGSSDRMAKERVYTCSR